MLTFLLLLICIINDSFEKLCPDLFGQFECPVDFICKTNECYYSNTDIIAPRNCEKVKCNSNSRCYKGRCYPTIGLSCNRNIQLTKYQAKSITSHCGLNGKCINGRCVEDRCLQMNCTENEICQDGKCLRVMNNFCISHFDCGPTFKCYQNKCKPFKKNWITCNCDPDEICQKGIYCRHVICEKGSFCLHGTCQTAIGQDCTSEVCKGGTICIEEKCILDSCTNRCPPDHHCREGQCRHLQGLLCHKECPKPYECIDGRCTRNECFGKICEPGEICQSGLCIKVEGRLCSLAIRDCADGFECVENICHDLLSVNTTDTLSNVSLLH